MLSTIVVLFFFLNEDIFIYFLCLSRLIVGTGDRGHFQYCISKHYYFSRPFVCSHQTSPSVQAALRTVVRLFYYCNQHRCVVGGVCVCLSNLCVCVSCVVRACARGLRSNFLFGLRAQLLGKSKCCLL